ncbi:MAG: DNA-protecting protein DprA [Chloroflexaceae bacterium]|nr:DNA-protecting protein DprA [Chloroflexaceae bacterium]
MTNHTPYYLGFNLVPGIGPTRLKRLIEQCGSVDAAWHGHPMDMKAAGLDERSIGGLLKAQRSLDLDAEMERVLKAGLSLLTIEDREYPTLLLHAPNAPPLLYIRGQLTNQDDWSLAVVGTRSPTTYGKEVTRRLVADLAQQGLTIVSGLAMGIDTEAHRAALEAGGRTIAVLGCGLDITYPERNRQLVAQIIQHGALISDYPLGTQPHAANFPPRNRIISGLSLGTLIIEAPLKSGALITTEFALEQGRDVFAVPGSIFSARSAGIHNLLRNGATLVTSAQDILEELNLTTLPVQQQAMLDLPEDPTEATLLSHLSAEPQHTDALCRLSDLPIGTVNAALAMLQLKGYVREADPGWYCRVHI